MSFGYQQERVLDGVDARAAILNLDARHNRLCSAGDRAQWIATFKHTGATLTVGDTEHTRVWDAWDQLAGGTARLVTVDHEITVDGVHATQQCIALRFESNGTVASGSFTDTLIYERGGWYYASRILTWDSV
jgi:hypothetical protein